ncbi:MAG: hypothetical protein IJW67_06030 [Blautia sp.]|nr:hypothetical protein [Blautia sp.]
MSERKNAPQGAGRNYTVCDWIHGIALVCTACLAVFDVIRYGMLGKAVPVLTVILVESGLLLAAWAAVKSRLPLIFAVNGAVGCILFFITNFNTVHTFNYGFLLQGIIGITACVLGSVLAILKKIKPVCFPAAPVLIFTVAGVLFLGLWKYQTGQAKQKDLSYAVTETWAVPSRYDAVESNQPGTVELISYQTKAYATDSRDVEKQAYVYLPYGYDESKEYNILYLMHGTGDNEAYWLVTYPYNKTMIDHMIETGDIDPLIIVTPSFYVEEDCADDLDKLTYSFANELRKDLMPFVEDQYATYAKTIDEAGFAASRDHRAFAGLSRGAVTTCHSVFCESLDYFSWFGTFSGCRTSGEYFQEKLQSEAFKDLPIHYFYMTSGNFDFSLPGQIEDYNGLLEAEPRLRTGVNTDFDIFPMRYHSIGSWHLALYNYLQRIF